MNKNQKTDTKDRIVNLVVWAVLSAFFVVLDQYTKHLAVVHLKHQKPLVLWEGVFEFLYSENRGAAFGILQGQQGFFFVIGIFVLAAAAYVMGRLPSWRDRHYMWLGLCVILITAGAVGNMADRILQGYVVDFLYFRLIDFPIFNVADIYVTTATAFLVVLLMFFYSEEDLNIFHISKKTTEEGAGSDTKKQH